MKRLLVLVALCAFVVTSALTAAEAPLRVFIRSGPKSHGPGAHDHPRFLAEWVTLLNARGRSIQAITEAGRRIIAGVSKRVA